MGSTPPKGQDEWLETRTSEQWEPVFDSNDMIHGQQSLQNVKGTKEFTLAMADPYSAIPFDSYTPDGTPLYTYMEPADRESFEYAVRPEGFVDLRGLPLLLMSSRKKASLSIW